eukprot:Phypoly_transcript_00863.p1 GENE.Phypoly_transcript_00863~~Phypoly_transcript_00863.p1  ORF type:complete len:1293 (+),score=225.30 Phypoly_transcript_00863:291-3881(+)
MGVFPEINRVWLTIDSNLYLWDYEDGHKYVGYSAPQVIVGVSLAKPLAGVWSPPPAWVLVVVTITQVILLSVNFVDGELRTEETGFSTSVDGIGMLSLASTNEGRVFLGGYDGNLYELSYTARSSFSLYSSCRLSNIDMGISGAVIKQFSPGLASWLFKGSSIIKVAVDCERSILYTLTQNSTITVYDIGGLYDCKKVGSTYEVNKNVQQFMQISYNLNVTNIIPIPQKESKTIHLLAITDDATRLYFSTTDTTLISTLETRQPPKGVFLIHAKRPGTLPFQVNCGVVTASTYYQGVTVFADPRIVGKDAIVASAPDYGTIFRNTTTNQFVGVGVMPPPSFSLTENASIFNAQVTVLAIAPEVQLQQDLLALSPLNLYVRQHLTPPPVFVFVSSLGLFKMSYIRPLDELAQIIRADMDIADFFNKYGDSRACTMALHISILGEPILQEKARSVFLSKAGTPKISGGQSNPATAVPQTATLIGSTVVNPTFTSSPGYEGLVLLLAAFFNSFWSRPLCVEQPYNPKIHADRKEILPSLVQAGVAKAPVKPPETVLVSRWDSKLLEDMSLFLQSLKAFFRRTPTFMPPEPPAPPVTANNIYYRPQPQLQTDTLQAKYREDMDLYNISLFVHRAIDACNFLIILSPFFPTLSPDLPVEARGFLVNTQLRDLICTPAGLNMAQLLMESLSKYASSRGMDVSNLTNSLLQSCPSFFSQLEKTKVNADDLLNKAIVAGGGTDGFEPSIHALEYLQPALRLYLSIVPKFDLGEVPDRFIALAFYPGVLELCFAYADALDPYNLALRYHNAEPARKAADAECQRMFNERKAVYAHILKVFDTLKAKEDLPIEEQRRREEMAADVKNMIFHHAINSKDELFHYELYDWYFTRGKGQEVVLMDTPFVEKYLESKHREALAQYYIRLQRFDQAAVVLMEQAELPNMEISDRVDNLSRAVSAINASAVTDPELVREMQDKLDVALVQLRIYDLAKDNITLKGALTEALLNLEQLFTLAGENDLKEGQLLVLSAANHKDERRVAHLWDGIVNESYARTGGDMRAVVAKVVLLTTSMTTKTNDYIPLGLLLDTLERFSFNAQQDPSFVFRLLVGTSPLTEPLNLWLEYYDLLKRTYWNDPTHRLHIYLILADLLEYWYKTALFGNRSAGYVTLGLDTKIDDIIAGLGKLGLPKAVECREKFAKLRSEMFPK